MERAELLVLLEAKGLQRVAAPLVALARDCITLVRTPSLDTDIPVGASKLGGAPDLPAAVTWPARDGVPYSFLCQVDCAAAAPIDPTGLLPRRSLLSFFLLLADEGYWRFPLVLYHDTDTLQRAALPVWPPGAIATPSRFFPELVLPACAVTLVPDLTIADLAAARVKAVGMTDEESKQYWELALSLGPAGFTWLSREEGFLYPPLGDPTDHAGHQMFGNAAAVQSEPCAPGGEEDWQVLLQLASDYHAHFSWGDMGILTWCIPADALRQRRFGKTSFTIDMA